MSTAPLTDTARGYLSPESKRQFTLVAGILGAVFFLAQFALPILVMLFFVFPAFGSAVAIADLDHAALWRGELWFVEQTTEVKWMDVESSATRSVLRRVSVEDLADAGAAVPLDTSRDDSPSLLPIADRLWVIGPGGVGYYEGEALTWLGGVRRPARASRPFALEGRPAVVSSGAHPRLSVLELEAGRLGWKSEDFPLDLPPSAGGLQALQAIEVDGGLYVFAELCTEEPDTCSIRYRAPGQAAWLPLVEDTCSCVDWEAIVHASRPAVVISQRPGRERKLELVTVLDDGPRRVTLEPGEEKRATWTDWHALPAADRLLLVSTGMPGSLTLVEMADGRPVRTVRTKGSFPFGPRMMTLMWIPQTLPMALSLLLALVLTGQMRRHRTPDYVFEGSRRAFASLWRRALAQLVDIVPLAAGFVLPVAFMWRLFDDPERMVDAGPMFMAWFFGLGLAAFAWALLVLLAYSYFEGRSGRTPGKWLLGIRVLGTDLRPCGFGRAVLRNVLTFVDGFFNFLVGTLLVALTDNWQRLGDLAARTIVVIDDSPA